MTTLVPSINAAEDILPPFLIFKGQQVPDSSVYPKNTKICSTKSGYMCSESFLLFLKHFQLHRKKNENQCLLFLDGHSSHCSIEALEFCELNKITLVCIPPHSSHRLQPLDTHVNKQIKSSGIQALPSF